MSDEFRDYKSNPTSDTLIRLLRAQQDRIYRLCFQVLRREHDAQDAAQEALVRIPEGVRAIDDVAAFHRWTYRVCLNSALESARKAARRRVHESRAAMKPRAAAPLDDESRRALFEGIAKLGDASRGLLLDHHFEGETLESLAAREGVSPQAVSKRLERAREELRRALPASLAAAFDLAGLFQARGAAGPDLVSGPVLAKVAAVAGGAMLTTKSVLLPVLIALLLVLSAGGGLWVATRSWPAPSPPEAKSGETASRRQDTSHEPATAPILKLADVPANSPLPRLSPLRIRLDQFRNWWIAKEKSGFGEDPGRNKHDKELWEQVKGLRALILADPEEFLAFLKDSGNEGLLMDLTQMNPLVQTDRPYVSHLTPFDQYPEALKDGLLDLLITGTPRQRVATFRLLDGFPEIPDAFKNVYLTSVDDPHPDVQAFAIRAVGLTLPISPALHSKLTALGSGSESPAVRQAVVAIMAMSPGAGAETFLLNRMETATDSAELYSVIFSLERRYANRGEHPIQEEAAARAASAVVARSPDIRWCRLLNMASYLSGERLKPILSQIIAKSADVEFRGRVQKAVEMIDRGETNREELMQILEPPKK